MNVNLKRKTAYLIFSLMIFIPLLTIWYNYANRHFKPYKVIGTNPNPTEDSISITLERNLRLVQNNPDVCQRNYTKSTLLVVNLIVSARNNFENRKAVRETWGSTENYGEWTLRVIFLLGLPSANEASSVQLSLNEEIQSYGDIIMGNFEDTYHNLGYKHLMGYKWVLEHCPWANAVVKNDDDVFLNVFGLANFLSRTTGQNPDKIYCWEMRGSVPRRKASDKWYVSPEEYPFDVYPNYCTGASYVTSPRLMKKIYKVRNSFRYFWIDDIYVSGILRSHQTIVNDVRLENIRSRFTFYSSETERDWDEDWIFVILPRKQAPIALTFYGLWRRVQLQNNALRPRSSDFNSFVIIAFLIIVHFIRY